MTRFQFGLSTLFAFTTVGCILAWIASIIGPITLLIAVLVLGILLYLSIPIFVVWGIFYVLAPDATKYGTAFGFMSLASFTLISCGILRAREQARQTQCIYLLSKQGRASLEYRSNALPTEPFSAERFQHYLDP